MVELVLLDTSLAAFGERIPEEPSAKQNGNEGICLSPPLRLFACPTCRGGQEYDEES